MYFFFGCLKQPTVSTGPAQRALKKPAAAAGTAKEAMEQNQPDPLPQPQPTAPVATRVAPQLTHVPHGISLYTSHVLKLHFIFFILYLR